MRASLVVPSRVPAASRPVTADDMDALDFKHCGPFSDGGMSEKKGDAKGAPGGNGSALVANYWAAGLNVKPAAFLELAICAMKTAQKHACATARKERRKKNYKLRKATRREEKLAVKPPKRVATKPFVPPYM